ncbi:MAG TPA: ROK family protein [Mobilitalea sp.]|nr:ROK family protein [Mobilitalea sp.]
MLFGALEAGGTKMVMAVGDESGKILEHHTLPTYTPAITLPKIIEYFESKNIEALGIGSFGPLNLDRKSKTYGYITSTPKLAWANYDIVGNIKKTLNVPIGFDTDVNAAVLAEATWGSIKGLTSGIYITVGTGIGVGVYLNGSLLHGMLHPEAGHILLSRHPEDDFTGVCPYHPNCMEGLASGPSIEKRFHKKATELQSNSMAWEFEAYYLAQGIVNYILTLSPHKIVLGGGVMNQEQLFPRIRSQVTALLKGYIQTPQLEDLEHYIVPSPLDGKQGIMGCIQLAKLEINL